jgi:hypothetical protein
MFLGKNYEKWKRKGGQCNKIKREKRERKRKKKRKEEVKG